MFVLNCPTCGHQSRVKFARMGAVATCVGCKQKFKVDSHSLIVEEDSHAAPASAPAAQPQDPAPAAAEVTEPAVVAAPESMPEQPPAETLSAAEALEEAQSRRPRQPQKKHRRTAPPRPPIRKKKTLNSGLILLLLVGIFTLGGGLAYVLVYKNPFLQTPTDPDKTVAEIPPAPVQPVKPPEPPPKMTPPKVLPSSGLPRAALDVPPRTQVKWSPLDADTDPFHPTPADDTAIWNTWLERRKDTGPGVFHAMFVLDRDTVHKGGYLRIQLVDSKNHAYAELKQDVPAPCAQRGVHVRIPIPADLLTNYASHVAEFGPTEAIADARVVELLESRTERLNPGASPPILKLVIRNPSAQSIANPHLILEVLDAAGKLLGTWQTELAAAKIAPGAEFAFEATPPLSSGDVPARVAVRGYGTVAR